MQKTKKRTPRTVAHSLSLTLAILLSFLYFAAPLKPIALTQRELAVSAKRDLRLLPGGMAFGVKMETEGVLVVGFSRSTKNEKSPAEEAGIKSGDVIRTIGGNEVSDAKLLSLLIAESEGKPMTVTVERNGTILKKYMSARLDADGCYRAGLRVRDGTAGIGTVTAIDPETMTFVGLGHGICDSDTGILMPLRKGSIYDVLVTAVERGTPGVPGEIKGHFSSGVCGVLLTNTPYGIVGKMSGKCFDHIQPMALAKRDEVSLGKATILCTLSDNTRREYDIKLVKLANVDGKDKNFVIEVTDPTLLETTGGIVQGMSGSPIIQNGKIIGAVTHVMVNEPTKGYGIFIENMLNAASFDEFSAT